MPRASEKSRGRFFFGCFLLVLLCNVWIPYISVYYKGRAHVIIINVYLDEQLFDLSSKKLIPCWFMMADVTVFLLYLYCKPSLQNKFPQWDSKVSFGVNLNTCCEHEVWSPARDLFFISPHFKLIHTLEYTFFLTNQRQIKFVWCSASLCLYNCVTSCAKLSTRKQFMLSLLVLKSI